MSDRELSVELPNYNSSDEWCDWCGDDNVAITIVKRVPALTSRTPFCMKCFDEMTRIADELMNGKPNSPD